MNIRNIIVVSFWLIAPSAFGQNVLRLETAIAQALENNHVIKMEKLDARIAENKVSKAFSGQMPLVEFQSSYEYGINNVNIETLRFDGGGGTQEQEFIGAPNNTFQAGVSGSFVLFDGFKGRYRFRQLEKASTASQLQLKQAMENTVSQVISAYIEVARKQSQLNLQREIMALSQDRLNRVELAKEYGNANSLRALQAAVDMKSDSAAYRNYQLEYANAKNNLSYYLGEIPEEDFTVSEEIFSEQRFQFETLQSKMLENNVLVQLAQIGIDNSQLNLNLSEAVRLPTISLNNQFSYFHQTDEGNFLQSNERLGPSFSLSMRYTIFNGGKNRIEQQNAKLLLAREQTSKQQLELELEKQLSNAFAQWQNSLQQLRIEQSNLPTFELNYQKMEEDFERGLATASDVRTAQLNLSSAKNRLNNLHYNVKLAAVFLLQLSGNLLEP